jgi:hypothetical protein
MLALVDPAPGARPESADEVLDRWRAIADGLGYRDIASGRGATARAPRRAIALTAQVGRDRERLELERAWAEAKVGRGSPIAVAGEPGIGKSRLLAETSLHVQLDGGEVVRLSARASDGAWAVLRALVRGRCSRSPARRGPAPAPPPRRRSRRCSTTARRWRPAAGSSPRRSSSW